MIYFSCWRVILNSETIRMSSAVVLMEVVFQKEGILANSQAIYKSKMICKAENHTSKGTGFL